MELFKGWIAHPNQRSRKGDDRGNHDPLKTRAKVFEEWEQFFKAYPRVGLHHNLKDGQEVGHSLGHSFFLGWRGSFKDGLELLEKLMLDLPSSIGLALLKVKAVFWAGNLLKAVPAAA